MKRRKADPRTAPEGRVPRVRDLGLAELVPPRISFPIQSGTFRQDDLENLFLSCNFPIPTPRGTDSVKDGRPPTLRLGLHRPSGFGADRVLWRLVLVRACWFGSPPSRKAGRSFFFEDRSSPPIPSFPERGDSGNPQPAGLPSPDPRDPVDGNPGSRILPAIRVEAVDLVQGLSRFAQSLPRHSRF